MRDGGFPWKLASGSIRSRVSRPHNRRNQAVGGARGGERGMEGRDGNGHDRDRRGDPEDADAVSRPGADASPRGEGLAPPAEPEPAPIAGLLERISDLAPDRIAVVTRTLGQMSAFDELVREEIAQMEIGNRYETITRGFDSIRDDAKRLVDHLSDGQVDLFERATDVTPIASSGAR
jgi:hypothetical protein